MFSVLLAKLFGSERQDTTTIDRTIDALAKSDDELDRRIVALRAQVQAQTQYREERQQPHG